MSRSLLVEADLSGELDNSRFHVRSLDAKSIQVSVSDLESAYYFVSKITQLASKKTIRDFATRWLNVSQTEITLAIPNEVVCAFGPGVGSTWLKPFGLNNVYVSRKFAWFWVRQRIAARR